MTELNAKLHVLLVEDSRTDARLVEIQLEQADRGFGQFRVDRAVTLSEALTRLAHNQCQIVLLDLVLPDSQGVATIQRIHAAAPRLPIVVLTGRENIEQAIEALGAGADDYLFKGETGANTLARTLRFAFERRQWRVVQEEIRLAGILQRALLPKAPPACAGLDLGGSCRPAATVGGDYFDFLCLSDGSLGVVVADVMGHGLAPALIMAGTRRVLRGLACTHHNVGEILTLANRMIGEDTSDRMFVTLFLARIDPATWEFSYASAGHAGYHIHADGTAEQLLGTGIPLGLLAESSVESSPPGALRPGDMLLIMTDGVEDAHSAELESYGAARALECVRALRDEPAAVIVDALLRDALAFSNQLAPLDDMTAVLLKAGA